VQGAGGNCNVVKEIIYPLGAQIDVRAIRLGDATLSVLEIWGAEYQENDCLLIKPDKRDALEAICARERCLMQASRCSGLRVRSCLGMSCVWNSEGHRLGWAAVCSQLQRAQPSSATSSQGGAGGAQPTHRLMQASCALPAPSFNKHSPSRHPSLLPHETDAGDWRD
jgi:hypothetical protein